MVDWQSESDLDSIRNSCDVLYGDGDFWQITKRSFTNTAEDDVAIWMGLNHQCWLGEMFKHSNSPTWAFSYRGVLLVDLMWEVIGGAGLSGCWLWCDVRGGRRGGTVHWMKDNFVNFCLRGYPFFIIWINNWGVFTRVYQYFGPILYQNQYEK